MPEGGLNHVGQAPDSTKETNAKAVSHQFVGIWTSEPRRLLRFIDSSFLERSCFYCPLLRSKSTPVASRPTPRERYLRAPG